MRVFEVRGERGTAVRTSAGFEGRGRSNEMVGWGGKGAAGGLKFNCGIGLACALYAVASISRWRSRSRSRCFRCAASHCSVLCMLRRFNGSPPAKVPEARGEVADARGEALSWLPEGRI